MNKNSPLNQRYICPIGADGIHFWIVLRPCTIALSVDINLNRLFKPRF